MAKTVMKWRIVFEWEGDTEEAAIHKAKRFLDVRVIGKEHMLLDVLGKSAVRGGLEGHAECMSCGGIGITPAGIPHADECK
jgi:hypothetical protein